MYDVKRLMDLQFAWTLSILHFPFYFFFLHGKKALVVSWYLL